MFNSKKTLNTQNNDMAMLKECMSRIIAGDFSTVSQEGFTDIQLPEMLNQIIITFKKFNNNFIMRMNDAMEAIGDNSYVKNLLDQVTSQTQDIDDMGQASKNLEESIYNISNYMGEIRSNINDILASSQRSTSNMNESIKVVNESSEKISTINQQIQDFRGKLDEIGNIVDVVRDVASQSNLLALNASIEAARAGDAGRGFSVVAEEVRQLSNNTAQSASDIVKYVQELQSDISALAQSMDETSTKLSEGNAKVETSLTDIHKMNEQMTVINDSANVIFNDIDKQSEITKEFARKVDSISDSYSVLSNQCQETGVHIYKIGRYIDTCRSDMYREAGMVTTQDKLTVFEIDHFILMWRVYNNAVGFETLKLTQLNNPDKCKLGLWMASQTDPKITGSRQFKNLDAAHKLIHKYACESWKAKDNNQISEALAAFQKCYDAYTQYRTCIHALKEYMRTLGYTDETEIVVFRK